MRSKAEVLNRLNTLIEQGTLAENSAMPIESAYGPRDDYDMSHSLFIDVGIVARFRTASLSFLKSTFGEQHPYFQEFTGTCRNQDREETRKGLHILFAARDEIDSGYLGDVQQILRAEVFADFLEMAEHLLEQGYKDPAAVMVGSVLEDHLRQLAAKHAISVTFEKDGKQVPKKADALNAELKKAEAYGPLDQKAVTLWLGLRNDAAHGKYDQYTKEQVQIMLSGVLDFVRRVSLK